MLFFKIYLFCWYVLFSFLFSIRFFFPFFFFFGQEACRILVPRPGIEPLPPEVEARSFDHWNTREVPHLFHVILITHCGMYHHPHFVDKKTKVQRTWIICPSHTAREWLNRTHHPPTSGQTQSHATLALYSTETRSGEMHTEGVSDLSSLSLLPHLKYFLLQGSHCRPSSEQLRDPPSPRVPSVVACSLYTMRSEAT